MKVKILTTILVVALFGSASVSALKLRNVETKAAKAASDEKLEKRSDKISDIKDEDNNKDDNEKHKRGVYFHGLGGGLAANSALSAYYPRTYASHFGYNLHLPGATSFSPSALAAPTNFATFAHAHAPAPFLRYPLGTHFKTGYATLPTASHLHTAGVLPHFSLFSNAAHAYLPHAYVAGTPAVTATQAFATSPAVLPAPAPALAGSPAFVQTPPLADAPALLPPAPVANHPPYILGHGGAVVSSYSANYPHHLYQKPAVAVQQFAHLPEVVQAPIQPIHPVQPVQPVQHVTPVQTFRPVQPVQPIPHQFVQTNFVQQPAPVPSLPSQPAFQFFPSVSSVPALPASPAVPIAPVVPASPPVFPTSFRPFVQPAAVPQQPVNPLPGNPPAPDTGSAVASPQIPPSLSPQPEQPQSTQDSWKPVVGRPSNTLMPPFGAPSEAYLPPATSSNQQLQQQQLNSHLFDNLTESEIEHIFKQAQSAQQQNLHHYHQYQRNAAYQRHQH